MPEIRVARIEHKRWTFEVNVDTVEAVLRHDLRHRIHEVRNACGLHQRKVLSAAAQRDQHLLSLALQPRDVVFHLRQIEARPHMQLQSAFCRLMIHVGKGHNDHIPLRRNIAQPEYRSPGAAPRPVPDQFVPVLGSH